MKIGYPCINRSIGCTANSTFRLGSYSEERLFHALENNLSCLMKILEYNAEHGLLFFRISSDLVPFASHPVCTSDWAKAFRSDFSRIGDFIKENDFRISMHPDQFVLLNSPSESIVQKSVWELEYHARVLEALGLVQDAKIQIHVGGVYGEKPAALERFCENYALLGAAVKRRLVIENDERLYSLSDCVALSRAVGVPVLFDSFHHSCLNNGESLGDAISLAASTWNKKDGLLMVDYSSQEPNARLGKHAETLDARLFREFLSETKGLNFDVMLEIKDKEKSALKALKMASCMLGATGVQ